VPDGVDLKSAASATLGAIALHGVRTADARLGETAVVVGLGLLGQMAAQMLRASGVRVVAVDRDASRAALAKRLGADVAISGDDDPAAAIRGLTGGQGADVAIVCAGSDSSEPVSLAASLCRRRGVVVVVGAVGMDLDRRTFYEKELSLRMSTSYGPGRYDPQYEERGLDYPYAYVRWTEGRNLGAFLDLVARKAVDLGPLCTHEFGIEEAETAYDLVTGEKKEPYLGILLRYDGEAQPAVAAKAAPRAAAKSGGARVGVIGAGQFGTAVLLPALKSAQGLALTAISTAGGATADAVKRSFGFARVASGAADVMGAADVDAVVIATRHDSHARLVQDALAAGKPCFVEKPLAIRPEELADVVAAMQAKPGLVCVGFNRRFAPAVVALKKQLASRTSPLHARYRVNAGAIPASHWTRDPDVGGGRIVGEACHFVDLLAFVVGSRVDTVMASRVGDDGASALLRFADGSTATLDYVTTGDASIPKEHLDLHWEGTSFVLDDFRSLAKHSGGRRREVWSGSQDKGHAAEIAAWARAVVKGESSPVPFDEAVAATEATFAVLDSIATGAAIDLGE
jgi:polar amino acid transport system substrate-binding protein